MEKILVAFFSASGTTAKAAKGNRHPADNMLQDVYIYQEASFMVSEVSFILHCIMEKVLVGQQLE